MSTEIGFRKQCESRSAKIETEKTSRNACANHRAVTSQFSRNFPGNFDRAQHTEIVIYASNTITQLPEVISVMMSHTRTRQDTLIAELSPVVNDFLARYTCCDITVIQLLPRVGTASIVSSDFAKSHSRNYALQNIQIDHLIGINVSLLKRTSPLGDFSIYITDTIPLNKFQKWTLFK